MIVGRVSPALRAPYHFLAVLALVLPSAPSAAGDARTHWGRDRTVDLHHVRLDIAIDVAAGRVDGDASLDLTALEAATDRIVLDARELEVRSVTWQGGRVDFDHDGEELVVGLAEPLSRGQGGRLVVSYSAEPRNGLFFVRPDRGYPDKSLQCWSQGETESNSYWFPVHDYPNERLSSETVVTVDAALSVVGNGRLLSVRDNEDGTRTWHHRLDFPHVPYLVSLAIGAWEEARETWRGIELSYHVPPGRGGDIERSFANTAAIMEFLSEETGVPYPYPVYRQVCVTDYMFGGMENITATTLNERTLHDERAHQDWKSDSLVAHEAAHQWFGDLVTCEDWSDAWLNEGFATYYAALSMGHVHGAEQLVVEFDRLRRAAISADAGHRRRPIVTNHYDEPFDLFDGHAYAKGAMVLRALRRELGPEAFRTAVRHWLETRAGRSVDTRDLVQAVEESTGRDVSRFFHQWIYGAGQPELEVRWRNEDGGVAVTVRQTQEQGEHVGLFDVPLDLRILGEGFAVDRAVRLSRAEETFHVAVDARARAVVVDPDGWLLHLVDHDRPAREAAWVLEHATSLHARLGAARELAEETGRKDAVSGLVRVLAADGSWALRREVALALEKATGAPALEALLTALSSDPDSRVRTAAAGSLGAFEGSDVGRPLARALTGDDSYAVRAACARALGRAEPEGAARLLERALSQTSHRDEVFRAALSALLEVDEDRAARHARRWTSYGRREPARNHAVGVLAEAASRRGEAELTREVREHLLELLDDSLLSTRRAAARALVVLGDGDAVPALRRLASAAAEPGLRRTARDAARDLERKVDERREVGELARQLREEREAREELERRLDEIEHRLEPADAGEAKGTE